MAARALFSSGTRRRCLTRRAARGHARSSVVHARALALGPPLFGRGPTMPFLRHASYTKAENTAGRRQRQCTRDRILLCLMKKDTAVHAHSHPALLIEEVAVTRTARARACPIPMRQDVVRSRVMSSSTSASKRRAGQWTRPRCEKMTLRVAVPSTTLGGRRVFAPVTGMPLPGPTSLHPAGT
ncbi:hypothetical protein GGX14DRAFT_674533 [Mycena pura]|uniref:Uncharacterized protein n=1 Tax=Mycena pura TaxID=153505 RepID=A0AAD6Y443_9AGAR|nr:hypothetical protein GGX14DRAFT_674533 [Mycena pura]